MVEEAGVGSGGWRVFGLLDSLPEIQRGGEGFLVGGDDVDALAQDVGVCVCDVLAACVVD